MLFGLFIFLSGDKISDLVFVSSLINVGFELSSSFTSFKKFLKLEASEPLIISIINSIIQLNNP